MQVERQTSLKPSQNSVDTNEDRKSQKDLGKLSLCRAELQLFMGLPRMHESSEASGHHQGEIMVEASPNMGLKETGHTWLKRTGVSKRPQKVSQ